MPLPGIHSSSLKTDSNKSMYTHNRQNVEILLFIYWWMNKQKKWHMHTYNEIYDSAKKMNEALTHTMMQMILEK